MRAKLLGERSGIGLGDVFLSFLDQFSNGFAEVCFEHAAVVVQIVQFQTAQCTHIDGLGNHDVLDEHVGFIAVVPRGMGKRLVIAVILATTDDFAVINGIFGLCMAKFLKSVSTEDVHGRIVAAL